MSSRNQDSLKRYLLLIGSVMALAFSYKFSNHYFWDLNVYESAVTTHLSGGSSYHELDGLRFVYPPYVLKVFSLFDEYITYVLLLGYLVSGVFVIVIPASRELVIYTIISSVCFYNDFFVRSIATGNLTIFMHFIVISLASYQAKHQRFYFLLATSMAALIKPYFLAYLLLGLFVWPKDKSYYKHAAVTMIAAFVIFVSQIYFTSELFEGFVTSLHAQAIGDGDGPGKDVGLAPYRIFGIFLERQYALLLHVIAVTLGALLFLCLYKIIAPKLEATDAKKLLFWIALISITLFNPRMKVYDYWILVGASTATIFMYMKYLSPANRLAWLSSIIPISTVLFLLRFYRIPYYGELSVYFPLIYCVMLTLFFARVETRKLACSPR